jgi:hypothetical protein
MDVRQVTVVDWDDIGQVGIDGIAARLKDEAALVGVRQEPAYDVKPLKDGRTRQRWVIDFDGNRVRDTWVNQGHAFSHMDMVKAWLEEKGYTFTRVPNSNYRSRFDRLGEFDRLMREFGL